MIGSIHARHEITYIGVKYAVILDIEMKEIIVNQRGKYFSTVLQNALPQRARSTSGP